MRGNQHAKTDPQDHQTQTHALIATVPKTPNTTKKKQLNLKYIYTNTQHTANNYILYGQAGKRQF